jgi:RNA polymerase sigma-70 factor, ECF subfamily
MNRENFSIIVKQLSRKLYLYAYRILRNQVEAEDVVQDIFIKLWGMNERLDEYRSIDALATTMTRNCCIDILRRNRNDMKLDIEIQNYSNLFAPSPHETMEIRESDTIIRGIIENMPVNMRELVKLHDIDGKTYDELEVITGQNINTLRVSISRARKFIRDEYNRYQYEQRGH